MNSDNKNHFYRDNWGTFFLAALCFAVMLGMSYLIAQPGLTARELTLSQLISTLMSIVGSVLVTKVYAEKTSNETLRDHGVQIARGVMVLNSQIDSLCGWVEQKRDNKTLEPYDGALEHVELTLLGFKDMTSAALSGIAGIIGDALQQYQSVMDQISSARRTAIEESTQIQEKIESATSGAEMARLEAQLQQIKTQTEQRIAELTRKSALPIPSPDLTVKRVFAITCPYCSAEGKCEMSDIPGQTEVQICGACGQRFNSHVMADHKVKTRPAAASGALFNSTQAKVRFVAENLNDKGSKLLYFLQTTLSWVAPSELKELILNAVRISEQKQPSSTSISPHELQALLISEVQANPGLGIRTKSVRIFMKLLYTGRAFRPKPGEKMMFRSQFVNRLEEGQLLRAYLGSVAYRLKSQFQLVSEDTKMLSDLLLGEALADKQALLAEIIASSSGKFVVSKIPLTSTGLTRTLPIG